jgi:hypothetical protein
VITKLPILALQLHVAVLPLCHWEAKNRVRDVRIVKHLMPRGLILDEGNQQNWRGGDVGGEASAPAGLSFWVIRETVFPFFEHNIFYKRSPYLWWDGDKYVVVSQRWWQGQVRG